MGPISFPDTKNLHVTVNIHMCIQFTHFSVNIHIWNFIDLILSYKRGTGREVDLRMHTIRSHGTRVARSHKHDWFIFLVLVFIEIILNIVHPFYRFVGKDMMSNLKYPIKENTVPLRTVPVTFLYGGQYII